MTLTLYYHPFSSYCQKVLIALYERAVPFEPRLIDLGDPAARAELEGHWPFAKFPVLRDEESGLTVPESSSIIEYLDLRHVGPPPMIPEDRNLALLVRTFDRVFDNYVMTPLQTIVGNSLRPEEARDPYGVDRARDLLAKAYAFLDKEIGARTWAAGDAFTLADCAAAPALFYSGTLVPFGDHANLAAYYARLRKRPAFARAVDEARPYRPFFPLDWPAGHD